MDYLRTFAEQYGLQEIVGSLADRPNVQGAVLTLDDLWLSAWKFEETGYSESWEAFARLWRRFGPWPYPVPSSDRSIDSPPWIPMRQPDLKWRPRHWGELSQMLDLPEDRLPIRLIVALQPPYPGEVTTVPELPRSRLPVTFEVRPVARLAAVNRSRTRPIVGGISIGDDRGSYGTLGGILVDQSGQRYGMTCAHVLSPGAVVHQPAIKDDSGAETIGKSVPFISLPACPGRGPCNPYTNSEHIVSVDTTLVPLAPPIASSMQILSIGDLAGVVAKSSMTPGQEVTFEGRTSGRRVAELGGLGVFYRLRAAGQSYCFRDVFEVRWRSFARTLFGPVVREGDSGSWVCAETNQGPAWCGQIIGEDRRIGYAAYAETILAAWDKVGLQLSVT